HHHHHPPPPQAPHASPSPLPDPLQNTRPANPPARPQSAQNPSKQATLPPLGSAPGQSHVQTPPPSRKASRSLSATATQAEPVSLRWPSAQQSLSAAAWRAPKASSRDWCTQSAGPAARLASVRR